ncbi:MAG: hypothetical protein K5876_06385 [Ruminiclostridium sp.]|nr:hypothetical protein [Ruminiclostridium sp.]
MRIYGKKRALKALTDFSQSGRMPHALLLYGPRGIGKHTLADYAAMMYMCEKHGDSPCMECNECRRTESHIHPDVLYPLRDMSDNGKYNVDGLRQFIADCYIKPNDGDVRVCVFEKLDEMLPQHQNTLLKFIEEPLDFNRYIFIAEKKSPILQTVLSRVTALEVDGAGESEFTAALAEKDIPADRAAELYERFAGNIGAAAAFAENGEELGYVTAALKAADAIASRNETACLTAMLSLKSREELFEALGILSDIFAAAAGKRGGRAVSGAYRTQAEKTARSLPLRMISRLYDESVRLYGKSYANPNLRLFAGECCGAFFDVIYG